MMTLRRALVGFVLFFALFVAPLAGSLPVSAQTPTPTAQSTPASGESGMVPITDPRVDPLGTVEDAFFLTLENDSIVPAVDGTTALQPGEFKLLPSDVAVTEFYAEFYFVMPVLPEASEFQVGFAFWFDAAGNYYDFYLQTDPAGNTYTGVGYSPIDGDYQILMQTSLLAEGAIDATPGAENSIDLVVYDGYAIIEGNSIEPLAMFALPNAAVPGKVKAQIGFQDYGLPAGAGPLSVTISDFAVWDLSGGMTPSFDDIFSETATPEAGFGTSETPVPALGATGTAAPMTTATAVATTSQAGPVVPPTSGNAMGAAIFERERSSALAQPPLVGGASGSLTQTVGTFAWTSSAANVADFYAIATFVNPADLSVPSDIGIGFKAVSAADPGLRFIVTSAGVWYLQSPDEQTIASGTASQFDAAPGASNVLEVLVHGSSAFVAVNGEVLQLIDLSAFGGAGDVYLGTGFFLEDAVAGRVVTYSDFWVYPI
jgi:hypothetical protein